MRSPAVSAARVVPTLFLSLAVLTSPLLANALPQTEHPSKRDSNIESFWSKGSKLGAAWPDGDASYMKNLKGVNKMYTWTETCPADASDNGFTCLPQLWGWKNKDAFDDAAKDANPPLFLTFNEYLKKPARRIWMLAQGGHKLCSPATSSNPNGLKWVQNFVKQCPECEFDYVCVHWYDTTFEKFKDYVNLWHDTFKKPILITEFALQNFNGGNWQPSSGDVKSFYAQAIPWLNEQDFVLAYFPFSMFKPPTGINPNDDLLNGDGSLTELGSLVLSKAGAA